MPKKRIILHRTRPDDLAGRGLVKGTVDLEAAETTNIVKLKNQIKRQKYFHPLRLPCETLNYFAGVLGGFMVNYFFSRAFGRENGE